MTVLAFAPGFAFAQGPAAGPDAAVLQRLLQRHRPEAPRSFDFAAIGDQQYGPAGEAAFPSIRNDINGVASLQFTVHVGDVKSGSTLCNNEMFADRVRSFNLFAAPMILTPGDNEWTDCHRENNGSYDSIERLAYLRRQFYPNNQSFGVRKMTLSQQSEDPRYATYVENSMWSMGNILFATLHVVGSNNNLERNAANDAEWLERTNANFNWLKTIFAVARDNNFAGVVIVMQANPAGAWPRARMQVSQLESGFQPTFHVLEDEVIVYNRPVLMIYGDSHVFAVGKPLVGRATRLPIDTFTVLEVPGSGDYHWVQVRVDPTVPELFWMSHRNVPGNIKAQQRP
jgi:hypothetical protein